MYRKIIFVLIIAMMFCGIVSANQITDFGNGVYFFDGYPEMFGHDLSQFLTDHPQQRVVSIAAFDNAGYGQTSGYYVVFENKTPSYMKCYPGSYHSNLMAYNYTCVSVV